MKNSNGDFMYGEDEIKEEALKHYSKVFEDRPIDESIKHIKKEREGLCMARLEKNPSKQDTTIGTKICRKCAKEFKRENF